MKEKIQPLKTQKDTEGNISVTSVPSVVKNLLPKLRFPDFRDAGEWESEIFEAIFSFIVTNFFSREKLNYKTGLIKNIHYGDIHTKFATLFDIKKELVPFINPDELIGNIREESYCIEGDIILADASEDLDDIGKSIEIINLNNEKLVSGLHTILARPREQRFIIGFKGYLFKSDIIRRQIQKEAQGAKVLGISIGRLSNIKVCFPKDKAEQQRIADCLSSLDDLITAEAQKLEAYKAHKKGLMQELFPSVASIRPPSADTQRPEEDDSTVASIRPPSADTQRPEEDDNPVAECLRSKRIEATVPKLRFPEFRGKGEWEKKTIENYIDLFSGVALKSEEISADESGIPILRGINITEGCIRHSKDIDRYFLGDLDNIKKFLIKENDIVIGMDGSKVGKNVALIKKEDENSLLIQRVARIRTNKKADINYIYQHFMSDKFRGYVDAVNTSSGIPHISAQQIKDYQISFPPSLPEQQRIADCLSSLDELISAQAQKVEALKMHKKGLMQGLFPSLEGVDA